MVTERRRASTNKALDPRTKREISDVLADDVSKWLLKGNEIKSVDFTANAAFRGGKPGKGAGKTFSREDRTRQDYAKRKD